MSVMSRAMITMQALASGWPHIVVAALATGIAVSAARAQQGWDAVVVIPAEPTTILPFGEPVVTPARRVKPAVPAPKQTPAPVETQRPVVVPIVAEKAAVAAPRQEAGSKAGPESTAQGSSGERDGKTSSASLARQYCANIADVAMDARVAWQKKQLSDIEKELEKRIALLEAKTAEYKQWLARRDEFSRKVQDGLVVIYSRMRPEAAAMQLVSMDEETAAAILVKLDARAASAVLNEMAPAQAARLTTTISGAAKVPASTAARPAGEVRQP